MSENPNKPGNHASPGASQQEFWQDQRQFWNDQRAYWKKDLLQKQRSVRLAVTNSIVSICGFMIVIAALFLNLRQAKIVQKNLRNSVQQSMVKLTTDLDKIYVDHPEMREYVYGGRNRRNWDVTDHQRAKAVAAFEFDVFDIAASQSKTFRDQWLTPEAWTNWIVDEFASSGFLRSQFQTNQSWYGKDMKELLDAGAQKARAANQVITP